MLDNSLYLIVALIYCISFPLLLLLLLRFTGHHNMMRSIDIQRWIHSVLIKETESYYYWYNVGHYYTHVKAIVGVVERSSIVVLRVYLQSL
jgi:hypothetical protein